MPDNKETGASAYGQEQKWGQEIKGFLSATVRHWVSWLGATVLSIIASFYQGVGGIIPPFVFWISAVMGVLVAAFLTWQDERRKVIELQAKLTPKLKLTYGADNTGCIRPGRLAVTCQSCLFHRISVENLGPEPLSNCKGVLTKIEKDGHEIWGGDNADLPFAPSEGPDSICKTVNNKTPEFLDVIILTDHNIASPAVRAWRFDIPKDSLFKAHGDYLLHIAVSSSNSASVK